MTRRSWVALLAAELVGCNGEVVTLGIEEPLRVENAQFRAGVLPGQPALTAEQLDAGETPTAPYPTPLEVAGRVVSPNGTGFVVGGRASTDTYAIGLAIAGASTGYWVIPVGAPDPSNADELTWSARIDFGESLQPGLSRLTAAAFDEQGRAGTQRELELCVRSPVADNLNACDPAQAPPAWVVSLAWNSAADLDLAVSAADGSVVNDDSPSGDGDGVQGAALTLDANAGCAAHGVVREQVVWQERPVAGTYAVFVKLQDPCEQGAVAFVVTTHESAALGDGEGFTQIETSRVASVLNAIQASAGAELGQRVLEFSID